MLSLFAALNPPKKRSKAIRENEVLSSFKLGLDAIKSFGYFLCLLILFFYNHPVRILSLCFFAELQFLSLQSILHQQPSASFPHRCNLVIITRLVSLRHRRDPDFKSVVGIQGLLKHGNNIIAWYKAQKRKSKKKHILHNTASLIAELVLRFGGRFPTRREEQPETIIINVVI